MTGAVKMSGLFDVNEGSTNTMAKAKSKAKSNTKAKSNFKRKSVAKAPTLPSGYKVIGRAPNWDPEKDEVIEGERGETKEVTFNEGVKKGPNKERTVRTMIVQDETIGAVNVWESGMLRDLFDQTEAGDKVRIEFLGYGEAKKGQNAPKLFSCGVAD
jgi:hypothetical protein